MTPPASPRRVDFVRAFLSSALATGLSRILGAARDVTTAATLGASEASDAFNTAYAIPNLFRRFVADEGLTGALIPALAKAEADGGEPALRRLGGSVFAALILANIGLCVLGIVFAEQLVLMLSWSWKDQPELLAATTTMTRWMFPFVGMVSMVSYYEALLNYRGHFFVPKFAPALVSFGVVAGALFLGPLFDQPVHALVFGTLAGGFAMVLINLPPLARYWGPIALQLDFRSPAVRGIGVELSKVVVIGLFAQLNIIVLRQLAASLPAGSVTVYQNATHTTDLAQGIVAVGIGSALLPNISVSVASRNWAQFRIELTGALRLAAFLLFPAAVMLATFGTPITAMLFRVGRYGWDDVLLTGAALQCMAPFILGVAGTNIVKKVYFALEDRGTLLVIGALGVAVTGGLGLLLTGRYGVRGLAIALSLSTVCQLTMYLALLRWRLGADLGLGSLVRPLTRIAAATVPFGVVLSLVSRFGEWEHGPASLRNWLVFGAGTAVAGALYVAFGWVLGVEEIGRVVGLIRRRTRR